MNVHYRQGDVLLLLIAEIPHGAVPVARDGPVVLAEGEATGHRHAIAEHNAFLFTSTGDEASRFLRVGTTVRLVHAEHASIAVPPGSYRIIRQREFAGGPAGWATVGD